VPRFTTLEIIGGDCNEGRSGSSTGEKDQMIVPFLISVFWAGLMMFIIYYFFISPNDHR
jgi:hypothetical protein